MRQASDTRCDQHAAEDSFRMLAVRSYQQITDVLAQRDDLSISPARVRRLCRVAEMKIALALLADPQIRARLRPSAADGHRAMQLRLGRAYLWNELAASMD
jgi:hypothetical protein